ncbi:nucleoside hydrolase [Clostridium omnivorum]|uniref:Inosine-uridine preferring nucleoside hydrolase n=1 Tax=Clostridium omnivorum TaxID=1604902 RepID=A0ABQ5N4C2_9CLOT|nr:nucleoside hydrolase [Clostridium sp. E14]GLC30056.1 inosine-uridine preferring nucleoside hydrolase [Clostridium sp. E14]
MNKKVLFFGDIGVDDALAIIYAHLSSQIDIVGIVSEYGNAPRNVTFRNAHYLLGLLGKSDIPVFTGAERPLSGEIPVFYPEVHGPQGLGPIIPKIPAITPKENFLEVTNLIEQYKDELIIVATGRLTSLSTLFILYGDLMKHIKAYYIMGGAFLVPGNVTPLAEANFYGDPLAANIVMSNAKNANVFPLNVTMRALVIPAEVNYINQKGNIKIIKPMIDYYYNFYQKHYPNIQGSPMHDALAMSAVINDTIFRFVKLPVQVDTCNSISKGQSVADFRPFPEGPTNQLPQNIAYDFDYNQFINSFLTVMTRPLAK